MSCEEEEEEEEGGRRRRHSMLFYREKWFLSKLHEIKLVSKLSPADCRHGAAWLQHGGSSVRVY